MANYWISTFGGNLGERGYALAADASGNIYFGGYFDSYGGGGSDYFIFKYNTSGDILWANLLGGASSDQAFCIATDTAGNVYVSGQTGSTGVGGLDALIAKYDTNGNVLWQRTFGGANNDQANAIATDSNGNVYLAGYTASAGAGSTDVFIAKYDTNGTLQWQRALGSAGSENCNDIALDASGNVYIIGDSTSTGVSNLLVAKYNSSGTIQWQRLLGGANSEYGYGLGVDSNGNIYVGGSTVSTGAGGSDLFVAKYDNNGALQWQKTLGSTRTEEARSLRLDASGNVYVAGNTTSTGAYDFLIAKYDTNGNLQWQRTLGGSGTDICFAVALDGNNNLFVAGYTTTTGAGSSDLMVAKLPNDGSLTGVYGPMTYASCSLTDASSSLSSTTSFLSSITTALTSADYVLTNRDVITTTAIG